MTTKDAITEVLMWGAVLLLAWRTGYVLIGWWAEWRFLG